MDSFLSGYASVDSLKSPARGPRPVPSTSISSMDSVTSSPGYTPREIQSHLYDAFLSGDTADISLWIRGDGWDLGYRLHRIVLTQAGFFRSLFTGGFAETASNARIAEGCVEITFDDPNITRPAFEICIARLYGGGPPLYTCPSLTPSLLEPLTTAYTHPSAPKAPVPQGHHPATPHFLLSLLSTAIYLSIPSIASEALQRILASVGPRTVVRYLNYAIGLGIGDEDSVCGHEPHAAVGLEHIGVDLSPQVDAHLTRTLSHSLHASSHAASRPVSVHTPELELDAKLGEVHLREQGDAVAGPAYFYGAVGNRIGEAAACFLARWGVDLFADDEVGLPSAPAFAAPSPRRGATAADNTMAANGHARAHQTTVDSLRIWTHGLSPTWVRGLISSDEFFVPGEWKRYEFAKRVVELRRSLKGVIREEEGEWRKLFEEGIYYSSLSWEDLQRISEDRSHTTGKPYVPLRLLQAAHWQQSQLRHRVMNKGAIGLGPGSSLRATSPSPPDRKELGLAFDSSDLAPAFSPASGSGKNKAKVEGEEGEDVDKDGEDRVIWPVPVDTSLRIGDPTNIEGLISNQPSSNTTRPRLPANADNFFGLKPPRTTVTHLRGTPDPDQGQRYTPHAPFRFAVEFWGLDALKEKVRLHSHTVWYAGSLWNVYTQAVRKKGGTGVQVGVYLHRQSSVDPLPGVSAPRPPQAASTSTFLAPIPIPLLSVIQSTPSAPGPTSSAGASAGNGRGRAQSEGGSRLSRSRSRSAIWRTTTQVPSAPRLSSPSTVSVLAHPTSPITSPSSISVVATANTSGPSGPTTYPAIGPQQPYRDPRAQISAYFTIACYSAIGSSLTRFSSAPDTFAIAQSWGWKSSSLDVGGNGNGGGEDGSGAGQGGGPETSLRATIVLGLV